MGWLVTSPWSSPSPIAFAVSGSLKGSRFVKWKFHAIFVPELFLFCTSLFICIVHNRTWRERPDGFLEGPAGTWNHRTFWGNRDGEGSLRLSLLKRYVAVHSCKELDSAARAVPSGTSFLWCPWGESTSNQTPSFTESQQILNSSSVFSFLGLFESPTNVCFLFQIPQKWNRKSVFRD